MPAIAKLSIPLQGWEMRLCLSPLLKGKDPVIGQALECAARPEAREAHLLLSTLLLSHILVSLLQVDTMQTKFSPPAFLLSVM